MSVPILICACGLRVRAPGATPGRVGRCPNCGGPLTFPETLALNERPPPNHQQSGEPGYQLQAVPDATARVPGRAGPNPQKPSGKVFAKRKPPTPQNDGVLPPLARPETNWFGSFLYPLRGADSMGVVATTSAVLWLFTILVPEYCLGLIGDADGMGAAALGHLIALVSVLPFVLLFPLVIFYRLQYLGRTLVSSAMGETRPPRSPDRNFDGFFNGMSPWLIWLLLGVSVGVLPLGTYLSTRGSGAEPNALITIGLLIAGLPYMLMAMMMSFLHDHALAAHPWNVFGAIFRLGPSFVLLCSFVAGILALALGFFAAVWLLRENHFWIYIFLSLVAWAVVEWTSVVVMRVVGIYYHKRRENLHWHHERPRWGVAWRL